MAMHDKIIHDKRREINAQNSMMSFMSTSTLSAAHDTRNHFK